MKKKNILALLGFSILLLTLIVYFISHTASNTTEIPRQKESAQPANLSSYQAKFSSSDTPDSKAVLKIKFDRSKEVNGITGIRIFLEPTSSSTGKNLLNPFSDNEIFSNNLIEVEETLSSPWTYVHKETSKGNLVLDIVYIKSGTEGFMINNEVEVAVLRFKNLDNPSGHFRINSEESYIWGKKDNTAIMLTVNQ
jgi:hypothetical protein